MTRITTLLLATVFLAAPAAAQGGTCVFQVDPAQSSFSITGTTSLGPIVATPSSAQVSGVMNLDLATEGNPVSTGQLVGGDAAVQNIHVVIPNIFPFLPPLASVDVTNLRLATNSAPFRGQANGSFTTEVVITAISGIADVVPLLGDPSTVDLAGSVSDPAPGGGTVVKVGNILTLTIPIATTLDLADPGSGITGTVNLTGSIVATHDLASGCNTTNYASTEVLSVSAGGSQDFLMDAGPSLGGVFYWTLASFSGTSPGTLLGTVTVPLNFDPFLVLTLKQPFHSAFTSFVGFLDPDGQGFAALTLPPGSDPGLAGVPFHFAYVTSANLADLDFASNAVTVVFSL